MTDKHTPTIRKGNERPMLRLLEGRLLLVALLAIEILGLGLYPYFKNPPMIKISEGDA